MRAAMLVLLLGLPALASADSRDPVEPAPLSRLGPPEAPGARVSPAGAVLLPSPSRRSAAIEARWVLEAPPGPLRLTVPSSLFQVSLAADGAPLRADAVEAVEAGAAEGEEVDIAIDPGSGRVYRRGAAAAPRTRHLHRAALEVPATGRLLLTARAVLSAGHDKRRRRRLLIEETHLLHRRPDFLVYQFAVRGPGGPVEIRRPPRTSASARYEGGALRAATALQRPFPLGLTVGLGLCVSGPGGPGEGPIAQGLLRGSLDLLLPWGHGLVASLDAASDLGRDGGRHHVAGALVYQIYSPVIPYLIVPLGGHLQAGAALDLWPAPRAGLRLGLGLHLSALGLLLSADLFPERTPPPPGEAGPDRPVLRYRVGLLLGLAL